MVLKLDKKKKLTRKLISLKQSNLFLQSFLIQNFLTKTSNMILTQFQAMLQF